MAIENHGEIAFEEANDMNVPLNITLINPKAGVWEEHDDKFVLTADNYQPRRAYVHETAFVVTADSLEELQELVRKYALPLYQNAIKSINGILATKSIPAETDSIHLYYWDGLTGAE